MQIADISTTSDRSKGGKSTSRAKRAASAANGKAPVKPGSNPRGRPKSS